jgi:hypothetical protein
MTDPTSASGVPAGDLGEDDLVREIASLHQKRHDMLVDGTADQFRHHVERTDELEAEYLRRHPKHG